MKVKKEGSVEEEYQWISMAGIYHYFYFSKKGKQEKVKWGRKQGR